MDVPTSPYFFRPHINGGEYSDGGIQLCKNVSKANKVIKNKGVNVSFCKLKVLALNVCGLVSKLRNPDFR